LGEALQSVVSQTLVPSEIWVIDNCSCDRTRKIALSFSQVRCQSVDFADVARARSLGVAFSTGEFIAFLDQDDIWALDKLEKQVTFLRTNPNFGAVIGWQQMFLEPGITKPIWLKQEHLDAPQLAYLPSALLARRSAFQQTGNFDLRFSLASDVVWFLKAQHAGVGVGIVDSVVVHRRIHDSNMSHGFASLHREILAALKNSLVERRR
jgi:glycosyltransferase involved in cell wall biosynthesis